MAAFSAAFLCATSVVAQDALQDAGFAGPSYHGTDADPSGTKPESKLWFHDGSWWACLWSVGSQAYTIHELDTAGETWDDTGVEIDRRPISRADCLWDGTKLYVASHRWAAGGGEPGHPLVVYRYGYEPDARRYQLEPGFPVQIAGTSAETAVIDRDSTGTLWAVWIEDLRVRVTHTLGGDDRAWRTPAIHPQNTSSVTTDDVAALVHFGGDKIGVMWSDQVAYTYWFSVHEDGDPDTFWSAPAAILPGLGDDHLNLKAAADGRVFAALKTSTDEIYLAVRATNGTWTTRRVATAADGWTRAISVLDEDARQVHVMATSPIIAGTIYEKVSSMDAIGFAPGIGTPVIRDADDQEHNDSTSTKQGVGRASGLVVVASHQPTERYWHHRDDLGTPVPAPPGAVASATPRTGFAALTVQFLDGSRNDPTSWSWTFGDGTTSTERNPVHTYAAAGSYAVTLTASNALGLDTTELAGGISVGTPPLALTLRALEDTQIREASPATNYGDLPVMRVRDSALDFRAIVEFHVPTSDNGVVSARLRLWVEDGSPDGGQVFPVSPAWQEPFVNWTTAPPFHGPALGSFGSAATGTWVELDVSPAVAEGPVAFGITSGDANSVFYSSREGTHAPELLLTLAPPPVASFSADVTTGSVPLSVSFSDTSAGGPTSWLWDFGDGDTSTAEDPSHVYTRVGMYDVRLTVAGPSGTDEHIAQGCVRALPRLPVAAFEATPRRGPAPLRVQFTDLSARAASVLWNFGDGSTSQQRNPVHVYATRGNYLVTMTVTNAAGSDTETLMVHAGHRKLSGHALPRVFRQR